MTGVSIMKRALRRGLMPSCCCALVMLLCTWPARAAMVEPRVAESGSVIVTAETAEVREGPSPGAGVITVVGKGEIFLKEGRTGAWYYIRINDDAFGWISGRAVRRYQEGGAGESQSTDVGTYEDRPSSNYPSGPYIYPYYYWDRPSVTWEWYIYDRGPHRHRSWDHDSGYYRWRDHDHDRSRSDGWRRDRDRPRNDDRHRPNHQPRPAPPSFRGR